MPGRRWSAGLVRVSSQLVMVQGPAPRANCFCPAGETSADWPPGLLAWQKQAAQLGLIEAGILISTPAGAFGCHTSSSSCAARGHALHWLNCGRVPCATQQRPIRLRRGAGAVFKAEAFGDCVSRSRRPEDAD